MASKHIWLGALVFSIPFAFAACGDDEDDDGGDGSNTGGRSGSTGGSVTGGRSGAGMGGTTTGGRGGTSGRGGTTTGGSAGEGGFGGDDGGMGGDDGGMGGEPQGGTAGAGMGGTGGAVAGGGVGGAGSGGLAGGGVGGAGSGGLAGGGVGGAGSGGLAGGGMAGTGGALPTCDPTPAPEIYVGVLTGAAEVPPVTTTATGFVVAELNAAATQLTSSVYWNGLSTNVSNGHIHGPAAVTETALPVFYYFGMGTPVLPPSPSTTGSVVGMTFPITTAQQLADLRAGLYYANIHSTMFGTGEIRGQLVRASAIRSGNLVGAQEVPPVTTTATGRAVVAVFPGNAYASVSVSWTGLTTNTSAAHVHGPATFGMVANPPIFDLQPPLTAMSGSVVHKIWTLTGSQPTELLGSLHYANVHSTLNGSGEIRAQLLPPCP